MHLYAAGSNGSGQLAISHLEDVSTFAPTHFHPSVQHLLPGASIVDLVSTSTHALLLLHTRSTSSEDVGRNILLGAGTNTLGQLGPRCTLWADVRAQTSWKAVDLLSGLGRGGHENWEAVKIAATWTTSYVVYRRIAEVEKEGGVLGREMEDEGVEEMLVSCGSNDFGEQGRSDDYDGAEGLPSDLPTIINLGLKSGEKVEIFRGGQRHAVAVISDGKEQRVRGWGANRKGELDINALDSSISVPINATQLPSAGETEDGRSKGKGKGKGKTPSRAFTIPPTALHLPIPPGSHIVDIRLGASHTLALLSNGSVLAWGSDAKGQITDISSVTDISAIATTWGGSYFLCQTPQSPPELYSQGANTYNQLLRPVNTGESGRGMVDLPIGRNILGIAAGSEHLLIHLKAVKEGSKGEDELWVGGWNEHGNLGLGDKVDRGELVKVDLESLEGITGKEGIRIKGIWGGCGSSFVWLDDEY